jgi:hypothetical protein
LIKAFIDVPCSGYQLPVLDRSGSQILPHRGRTEPMPPQAAVVRRRDLSRKGGPATIPYFTRGGLPSGSNIDLMTATWLESLAKRPIVTSSALCHSIPPAGSVCRNSRIHAKTSSLAASLVQCNRPLRLTIAPSTTSGLVVLKRTAPQTTRSPRYIVASLPWWPTPMASNVGPSHRSARWQNTTMRFWFPARCCVSQPSLSG